MDVVAYDRNSAVRVELGGITESIWVGGLRLSQTRSLQISKPIGAPAPNIFDRVMRLTDFSFAAGRSFPDVGSALLFMGQHPDTVPAVADLQFTQGGQQIWLRNCGIGRVELVDKKSALVVFSYTITGGTWSKTRS